MILNKKVVVVLPAFNAAKTIEKTVGEIDREIVDQIIVVDDCSSDETAIISKKLGLTTITHKKNEGYGGNQKSCYDAALLYQADIVVMVHPDYQYTPKLIPAMASMLVTNVYDIVLASRIIGGKAIKGGMPRYKYMANRLLTVIENLATGLKLSEYHTGFRAYTKEFLQNIEYKSLSNDFIFDNEIIILGHKKNYRIGEISCPTRYADDSSSINLSRSITYGLGCIKNSLHYLINK